MKNRKEPQILREYKHQDLMKEFNEMMIRIKRHLFLIPGETAKPTNEELDEITHKIMKVLQEDNKPSIKYI